MLFANEPYFSAGTLFHVVGNIQQKWALPLGVPPLFQSMNENYGDFKKEIHHLQGKPFSTVAVKSSKYAFRVLDAAVALKAQGVADPHDPTALRTAMAKVLDVRQGKKDAGTKRDVIVWLVEVASPPPASWSRGSTRSPSS